jgi:Subtilase family
MSSNRRLAFAGRTLVLIGFGCVLSAPLLAQQDISNDVLQQISDITAIKSNFTPAQQKIDASLVFSALAARNQIANPALLGIIAAQGATDINSPISVDIHGAATPSVLGSIASVGGTVADQSANWGMIRATIPLGSLETVAASPDVQSIQKAAAYRTNGHVAPFRRPSRAQKAPWSIFSRGGLDFFVGALTSQGYVTHAANTEFAQGFSGAGVTVGVLSDSASAARIAALIATGDLPANTMVLPGQSGPSIANGGTDEGAAMMEIVHDMASGANLIFATADSGVASFASNIVALQQAGCKVIVDDVTYFNEGAFQDGPIARAVNQVVAAGAIYFSSAANSGNLTDGTTGTWEGDFLADGPATGILGGRGGTIHNFGTVASPQGYDVLTAATTFISLKWSDPLGGSTNDYDLYVLNSTGTAIVAMSTTAQTGTQDPYEAVSSSSGFAVGDRIVVVQVSGAQRALRIDTNRGELSIGTDGSTFGHNAGLNTVSTAATYWNSGRTGTRPFTGPANPIEVFSSDGPRKIFYNPDGSAITPGNFLFGTNGGTTLQKPDLTAADGVSATTPGFLPFFGTSAAAPHAAAIAALVLQARPSYTPAQVKTAMISGTVDNMAPGVDRDSGFGIVMATLAIQYALNH